ncbi:hypothetical protein EMQ25_17280 [Arsenicitalea aurantiaca]|uniref:Uncharacterized protein n=1 Tax=Arsenicitalea aurantiaca TaxID=1783274 RepID=A0A433X2L4_9HYPH|nr:hypothetical protein [Arsenicitalea aurantiaca]RUT28336.1 hypothetical protein EMQ25_17280 [Arsenicitalea aurantiaca]
MRLIVRVLGTWLLGVAVILLIIDGTKSLAANALVITSLGETWSGLHAESIASVRAFFATRLFGPLLDESLTALLDFPAFAVIAVPGIVLALMGRSKRSRLFMRHDRI